jgi:hypothetical protein
MRPTLSKTSEADARNAPEAESLAVSRQEDDVVLGSREERVEVQGGTGWHHGRSGGLVVVTRSFHLNIDEVTGGESLDDRYGEDRC